MTEPFPRDVYLSGGPLDGRIWTVEHPCFEMHFGGPNVVYRITDHEGIWEYVAHEAGSNHD